MDNEKLKKWLSSQCTNVAGVLKEAGLEYHHKSSMRRMVQGWASGDVRYKLSDEIITKIMIVAMNCSYIDGIDDHRIGVEIEEFKLKAKESLKLNIVKIIDDL